MYKLELLHSFSAAHKLNDYIGACSNLHGHTWKVKILIATPALVNSMVIDFKVLKQAIDERYDHKYINEQVNFNPTAENIAKDIYQLVSDLFLNREDGDTSKKDEPDILVTVWESDKASITYSE
jgi:6-pyruvoyltetrahydropterin/6-carboxytetrahydropterin synthase